VINSEKCLDTLPKLIERYSLELGIVADAYITSSCMVRSYRKGEAEKILEGVEELIRTVGENNC
jgi:hypothetical protein